MEPNISPYRVGDIFTDGWGVSRVVTEVRSATSIYPSVNYLHPTLGPQSRAIEEVDRYVAQGKLVWSRPIDHNLALPLGA